VGGARSQRPVWRTIAMSLAAGVTVVSVAGPAIAHPDLISTSPHDGAQLGSAPSSIVIAFDEAVTAAIQGNRIVDQRGATVPSTSKLSNKNKTLTITPKKRLGKGMYAAAYNLWSVERHFVPGAIGFTVATPTAKGSPVKIKPSPNIPSSLDGDRIGFRTFIIDTSLKKGEVRWRGPGVGEPITWKLKGNGKRATASGVLPTVGVWTFEVDLSTADSILIPKGQVTLK
jgi:methionine-rich copper-binding protein CopC